MLTYFPLEPTKIQATSSLSDPQKYNLTQKLYLNVFHQELT